MSFLLLRSSHSHGGREANVCISFVHSFNSEHLLCVGSWSYKDREDTVPVLRVSQSIRVDIVKCRRHQFRGKIRMLWEHGGGASMLGRC